MYFTRTQQLKLMMRFLYSVVVLLSCTDLSLQAKGLALDNPLPRSSSATGARSIPASNGSSAKTAKDKIAKKSEAPAKPVLTADASRAKSSAVKPQSTPSVALASSLSSSSTQSPHASCHTNNDASAPVARTLAQASSHRSAPSHPDQIGAGGRLARLTAYWAGEGDYYTGRCLSSTGVRLHDGLCAVDPNIIPYGSVVDIDGVGKYLAVDTGSAVISREAARESGHTEAERNALVIDLFFESSADGERFEAGRTKYASITWTTPSSNSNHAKEARSAFADENWGKIQAKQL